jgi:hypothetical protein
MYIPTEKDQSRFEEKIIRSADTDCWKWAGARYPNGYGAFLLNRRVSCAHRASYRIYIGTIKEGFYICHSCDERDCVNPAHLFQGTPHDNTQDMMKKGRHWIFDERKYRHGEFCPTGSKPGCKPKEWLNAKLTEDQVRSIRYAPGTQQSIADLYGISQAQVSKIKLRQSWKTVNE